MLEIEAGNLYFWSAVVIPFVSQSISIGDWVSLVRSWLALDFAVDVDAFSTSLDSKFLHIWAATGVFSVFLFHYLLSAGPVFLRHSGCLSICPFSSRSGKLCFLVVILCRVPDGIRVVSWFSYSVSLLGSLYAPLPQGRTFSTLPWSPSQPPLAAELCLLLVPGPQCEGVSCPSPAADGFVLPLH